MQIPSARLTAKPPGFFLMPYQQRNNFRRTAVICLIIISIFILKTTLSFAQTAKETIKIGFLVRNKSDLTTIRAAELAIEHANAKGGYQGKQFQLVTKSCDGPWGIGSKQAVSLVYDDEVSLLVGALDGRNAHLAEQVAAKSHIVMLSTQSSDPTLSRAYVPWYFRLVPDDRQQATVLVEEIYSKQKFTKVALVSLDAYDGKKSVESMAKTTAEKGLPKPGTFVGNKAYDMLIKSAKNPWDAVVLSGASENVPEIIGQIKSANEGIKIYAFINLFNFMDGPGLQFMENIGFVSSFGMKGPAWLRFERAWKTKYGTQPSPSLAFVYDGILLSVAAIRKFGPDPEEIKNSFSSMDFEGISGDIEFDRLGNREEEWKVFELTKR